MRARSLFVLFTAFLACLAVYAAWLEDSGDADSKTVITRKKKPSVTNITRETNLASSEMKTPDVKSVVTSGSYVTLIAADREKNSSRVIVTWVDLPQGGVTYKIYRSSSAISTITAFETARLAGTAGDNIGSFVDSPPVGGTYYYAVTASVNGVEQRVLVIDQSYTSLGVKVTPTGPDPNAQFVKNIKSFYEPNTRSIIVMWEALGASGAYNIYRSDAPIANEQSLSKATLLDDLASSDSVYVDRNIDLSRAYYYAVLFSLQGKEIKTFSANNNYTTQSADVKPRSSVAVVVPPSKTNAKIDLFDIDIPPLKTNTNTVVMTKPEATDPRVYIITNIAAESMPGGYGIRLSWELPQNVTGAFSFIIYRSSTVALSSPFALNNGLMHKIINPYEHLADNRRYALIDMAVEREKPYYYAVVAANGSSYLAHPFYPDVNYSVKPVILPKIDTNVPMYLMTNMMQGTNIISLVVTNTVASVVTNYVTNTVVRMLTNYSFITNVSSLSNISFLTNLVAVTNYVQVPVTNVITKNITNEFAVTNVIDVTNVIAVTNTVALTNRSADGGDTTYERMATPEETLRGILTKFYRGRFADAAGALNAFLASGDVASEDRSWYVATLFLGRSYLELTQYRRALDVFKSIRERSPGEVDFWMDKTITAMQRPNVPKEKKL